MVETVKKYMVRMKASIMVEVNVEARNRVEMYAEAYAAFQAHTKKNLGIYHNAEPVFWEEL